jgi:alkanesulfonate monooxygenase SsuD/methylene tetrahydromethanopterin reductase-like flavin-dependent oxidoreductase (luciferase family)
VAQQAEALGLRSLWVGDHVVIPTQLTSKYPYHPEGKFPLDPADSFLEPLTVLSYVAASTTTIRLGTGILIIPYRHPIVTAEMVATLNILSRGRVILGADVGWMAEEFAFLNAPYHEWSAQTDEYLRAVMNGDPSPSRKPIVKLLSNGSGRELLPVLSC